MSQQMARKKKQGIVEIYVSEKKCSQKKKEKKQVLEINTQKKETFLSFVIGWIHFALATLRCIAPQSSARLRR